MEDRLIDGGRKQRFPPAGSHFKGLQQLAWSRWKPGGNNSVHAWASAPEPGSAALPGSSAGGWREVRQPGLQDAEDRQGLPGTPPRSPTGFRGSRTQPTACSFPGVSAGSWIRRETGPEPPTWDTSNPSGCWTWTTARPVSSLEKMTARL